MSLKLSDAKVPGKKFDRPLPAAKTQPARIVHVIDLGVQKRRAFQGKDKDPCRQIFINLELVNEKHVDEESGKEYRLNVSPRRFNFINDEKSKLVQFVKSVDPENKCEGDLAKLVGLPTMVTVVHVKVQKDGEEATYANVGGIIPPPDEFPIKPLFAEPVFFNFDEPTEEALRAMPKFLHEIMAEAVNYKGSKTQALIEKIKADSGTTEQSSTSDDDAPWKDA